MAVKKAVQTAAEEPQGYNLVGQRLGRKGRDTRERILLATERLLAEPRDTPISLSAVARDASLGMTTLYLYFTDLTELLLAVLDPIMATAEESYVGHLRTRWPDEGLDQHCLRFVESFFAFWERHSRILHLRNSFADAGDQRMGRHRVEASSPMIELLVLQMDGESGALLSRAYGMATALLTGIERAVTVATDARFPNMLLDDPAPYVRNLLFAEARILELSLCDGRAASAQALHTWKRDETVSG